MLLTSPWTLSVMPGKGIYFVQKAPAATIREVALVVRELFNADNEIRVIGTRHGEKLYEPF